MNIQIYHWKFLIHNYTFLYEFFILHHSIALRCKHPTPMTTPSPVFTEDTEYLKELDFSILTDKSLKLFTTQELT